MNHLNEAAKVAKGMKLQAEQVPIVHNGKEETGLLVVLKHRRDFVELFRRTRRLEVELSPHPMSDFVCIIFETDTSPL